jgi:hypothetical protein
MDKKLRESLENYRPHSATIRLQHYLVQALARKDSASDKDAKIIRKLEIEVRVALQNIENGNFDGNVYFDYFAQALEGVIQGASELNLDPLATEIRSKQGTTGGEAKAAKSPKRPAKKQVYKRWKKWTTGERRTYKGKTGIEIDYKSATDFARQNVKMEDALDSVAVIQRWCGSWSKDEDIPK